MHEVPITATRRIADYAEIIGAQPLAEVRRLAAAAAGRSMLHINATAYGGGVAEILQNLVPLLRDAGIDAHWAVLDAPPEYFDVTKKIHNALQGMALDLTDVEKRLYLDVARANAAQLTKADAVLAHDPQAVALRHFAADPKRAGWAWRCHIDLTTAHQPVWDFIRPFVEEHDASIWTMPQFVRKDLRNENVLIQAPTIDPLSRKNREMPRPEAEGIVRAFGVDPARPILLQVSRFDPWKDPLGVIDAYRLAKREISALQLVSGVKDDEVNAFQRASTVVIQKSLREGFGLVVAKVSGKVSRSSAAGSVGSCCRSRTASRVISYRASRRPRRGRWSCCATATCDAGWPTRVANGSGSDSSSPATCAISYSSWRCSRRNADSPRRGSPAGPSDPAHRE